MTRLYFDSSNFKAEELSLQLAMLQANISPSDSGSFQAFESESYQNFDSGKFEPESVSTSRADELILNGGPGDTFLNLRYAKAFCTF